MKNEGRLKKSKEFGYVYKRGKSYADRFLIMYIVPNNSQSNKVGFSVSKKVGNSVKRNKIKRRLREIFRLNNNDIKKGYNLVFIPRAQISKAEYKDIENSMINLFKKAKILENKRDER
jgi:ribonuclease P protein component